MSHIFSLLVDRIHSEFMNWHQSEKRRRKFKAKKHENFFISEKISRQFFYSYFCEWSNPFSCSDDHIFRGAKEEHVVNTMALGSNVQSKHSNR